MTDLDPIRRSFGPQRLGLMLAVLGLALALLRATAVPSLPRLVPVVAIVTALGLIGVGILRRLRLHLARLR